jgi:solute:Na+ symporter, SSS family
MQASLPAVDTLQVIIFVAILLLLGFATWLKVRSFHSEHDGSGKDVFLAGGGLSWLYVAGAITITNLSTEQLVGMNGGQMLLLAWWEIAGFFGLMMLAFIFVPVYYRNNCTTVTELLERRYGGGSSIRTVIAAIFLLGNVFIYLPAALYSGSLFLKSMFGLDWPLIYFAIPMAIAAAIYTISGGLKAVAVVDTFSGIGMLAMALLVVVLALNAINWDFSGIPAERLTMVGPADSQIPFHTLFTGMLFIQIFYWSTNQNITQKAMTAPTVREAQKGVLAAATIRILIIPLIVAVPGVIAYKLYGPIGDKSYGRIVAELLPGWLSGAFASLMAAAAIAHTAAILNSSVALYSVDFHDKFVAKVKDHWRLAAVISVIFTVIAIPIVPFFERSVSIMNTLQQLNGLASMPILSVFVVGLLFRGVAAPAAIVGLVTGVAFYTFHNFVLYAPGAIWPGETFYQHIGLGSLHYIDIMLFVLVGCVGLALAVNRFILGNRARFVGWRGITTAD